MKKNKLVAIFVALVVVVMAVCLSACVETDKKYFGKIGEYSFWDNTNAQAIAQYKFYNAVDKYLTEGTIEGGNVVAPNGKVRKVLYVGWDGVRADALTNIFYDEKNFDTNGYNYHDGKNSGLHALKQVGGLYHAYAGGEKGKDSQQSSSTCAGWTSQLTGGWNTLHGVSENDHIKKAEVDTFVMKYAKLGLNTSLAFDWGQLFDLTLREEIKQKMQNPALPIKYCDIDRPVAANIADILKNEGVKDEKSLRIDGVAAYNEVACSNINKQAKYDIAMRDYLLERISLGDDIAAGIFHRPDTNGHTYGFSNNIPSYVNSVRNADNYLHELLLAVQAREVEFNEEWLVIATTDHGGSGKGHGAQVYEHRSTWVACNKDLSEYFGNNYNGYTEN